MEEGSSLSTVQRRILIFFQEQPQAVETVRGMATWLDAQPEAVQEALEELVERRWLLAHRSPSLVGYALTSDGRLLGEIQKALASP